MAGKALLIGDNSIIESDTSPRDLKKRMAEGSFREDLYFRLNVIAVEMPPLRARHGDLIRLAEHYLKYFSAQCGRNLSGFSEPALERLRAYSWPGNLRELRNTIERAAILARHDQIEPADLPMDVHTGADTTRFRSRGREHLPQAKEIWDGLGQASQGLNQRRGGPGRPGGGPGSGGNGRQPVRVMTARQKTAMRISFFISIHIHEIASDHWF